jgi:hypothetical protein
LDELITHYINNLTTLDNNPDVNLVIGSLIDLTAIVSISVNSSEMRKLLQAFDGIFWKINDILKTNYNNIEIIMVIMKLFKELTANKLARMTQIVTTDCKIYLLIHRLSTA